MSSHRLTLALGLALLCVSPALGQTSSNSVNLHHAYQPLDGQGGHMVDSAYTLGQWELHAGMAFSHAHRPLEIGRPGDGRIRGLVHQQTILDLHASIGLIDRLSFGVDLPVVLDNDGRVLSSNFLKRPDDTGIGALRIQLKYTAYQSHEVDEREEAQLSFAVALKPFLTLHTGNPRDYLSDNEAPTGGAMGIFTLELFEGLLRVNGEVGYEFVSSDLDLGDLSIRDRIRFGAGVEVHLLRLRTPRPTTAEEARAEIPADERPEEREGEELQPEENEHGLAIGAEVFGWTDAERPFFNERERPIEGGGFLRYRHAVGVTLTLGIYGGWNNGIGAPDTRYVASFGWSF